MIKNTRSGPEAVIGYLTTDSCQSKTLAGMQLDAVSVLMHRDSLPVRIVQLAVDHDDFVKNT